VTRDHYATLGVARDASQDDIRAARRARLREAHPDANPDDPAAAERFALVYEAGEVLGHPGRRRTYDASLPQSPGRPETCYETLGIAQDASGPQISEAYRDIVRAMGKPIPEKVMAAYRRIGDPRRRAGYDRGIGIPTTGRADDIVVHVPQGVARAGVVSVTVPDRDLCPHCDGFGRIPLPCDNCEGRGYWRWIGSGTQCDACNGRGTDERACYRCVLSGWVETTRTLTIRIPSAFNETTRTTVRDDSLGMVTFRLILVQEHPTPHDPMADGFSRPCRRGL
jgi:molecular chaperone DnaJ